jgi:uncharacterized protein DUF4013
LSRVTASFAYPFRRGAARAWLIGLPLVIVLPLGFLPLLGYSVATVRSSAADPGGPPPAWPPAGRLLADGFWVAALIAVVSLPFALLAWRLEPLLLPLVGAVRDPLLRGGVAATLAVAIAALPWGCLLLIHTPAATARYARSGAARDLFDVPAALRMVRARFPTWNLVVVAIVTAWALGVAGAGLACVGLVPGVLYALLASSHATAALLDA